jgi:hypothetical protein
VFDFASKYHHWQKKRSKILLVFKLLVYRDECLKAILDRSSDKRTILELFPLHLLRRMDFVAFEVVPQSARNIMVEQDLHGFGRSSRR